MKQILKRKSWHEFETYFEKDFETDIYHELAGEFMFKFYVSKSVTEHVSKSVLNHISKFVSKYVLNFISNSVKISCCEIC